jgi:hypothetical protein
MIQNKRLTFFGMRTIALPLTSEAIGAGSPSHHGFADTPTLSLSTPPIENPIQEDLSCTEPANALPRCIGIGVRLGVGVRIQVAE